MQFYNTLSRTKEDFKPIHGDYVGIYSCGPTVYNYAHVGNMRTYIFMDLLRRSLMREGYSLRHVMNITDVGHLVSDSDDGEDKMSKSAREQKRSPYEIAKFYTDAFMRDIDSLNITRPEIITPATEHIEDMIKFVQGLEAKGYAYETSDGIYYDIGKFAGYGKLSKINLDEQQAGARVEINSEKRHPADFALWKKAPKEHIMQWESPWGMGYPGWHIECSTMGLKYLGEEFDIHTGGVDHIPIHHENEIAQTEGLLGHPAAHFWMHAEFMLVNGGKMSKSLGNVYTLDDLAKKGWSPLDFRYFCLGAHYRSKLNFTFDGMDGAKKSLVNLRAAVQKHKGASDSADTAEFRARFEEAVCDDLNIPKALGIVWEAARTKPLSDDIYKFILECDKVLALDLDREVEVEADTVESAGDPEIEAAIAARADAKRAKNYAEADRIRNELAARGIILTDTPNGTTYKIEKQDN